MMKPHKPLHDRHLTRLHRAMVIGILVTILLLSVKTLLSSPWAETALPQLAATNTSTPIGLSVTMTATQIICPETTSETPTVTPSSGGIWYITSINGVDVLACPSADYAVIGSLDYNAVVQVVETVNGWHHILLADGQTGYIPEVFTIFVAGTAPPAPTIPPCTVRTDWPIYIVQRGDTLSNLALRVGRSVMELAIANCLLDINHIFIGQRLHVPFVPSHLPTATIHPGSLPMPNGSETPTNPAATPEAVPEMTISPQSGALGTTHNLTFKSFLSNQTVSVTIVSVSTGLEVLTLSATVNETGNGNASFTTRSDRFVVGNYIVRISGNNGPILQSPFEVEA